MATFTFPNESAGLNEASFIHSSRFANYGKNRGRCFYLNLAQYLKPMPFVEWDIPRIR
jgi:hypothetical protein